MVFLFSNANLSRVLTHEGWGYRMIPGYHVPCGELAALRAPNAKPSLGPVGSAHPSEPVWWQGAGGAGVGSQVWRWSSLSDFARFELAKALYP